LGERRGFDDESPVFALAHFGPSGDIEFLRDADGRLGLYRQREAARLAESLMPSVGPSSEVMVVPAWLGHVALDVVRRRGVAANKDDIYFVDGSDGTEGSEIEAAKHVVGVVAALRNVDSYETMAEELARQLAAEAPLRSRSIAERERDE